MKINRLQKTTRLIIFQINIKKRSLKVTKIIIKIKTKNIKTILSTTILLKQLLLKIININFINTRLFYAINYLFIYEKNVGKSFQ